jgi:transposase
MNKLNEILRLRFEAGRSLTDIACAAVVARSTVQEVLRRFAAAQLVWPLPDAIDDAMLVAKLYPPGINARDALIPDWGKVTTELKRKGVTRKLLWQEYTTSAASSVDTNANTNAVCAMPTPLLSYSQFCARLVEQQGIEPKMRQLYRPGEKLFVDYAGMTVPLIDALTGEIRQAQIFVSALGYSHAIYAEATPTQTAVDWLSAQSRALSFYGGVTDIVVPDNPRALVHKACRYEPTLNPAYAEWARHYGTTVLPARVRTPNDKAKVETAVQIVERKILAPLRDCQFFSLAELNRQIAAALVQLNAESFQKRVGSRIQLLIEERLHLKPLPDEAYQYGLWKRAKVHIDYHIEVDKRFYSVPYGLTSKTVDVRVAERLIEVYWQGKLAAAHPKAVKVGDFMTTPEHRAPAHQAMVMRSHEDLQRRAQAIGHATGEVIAAQMHRKHHPEQTLRSCLGILRLARDYTPEALEAACVTALAVKALSYRAIRSFIAAPPPPLTVPPPTLPKFNHDNVRGADFFNNLHQDNLSQDNHSKTSHQPNQDVLEAGVLC